MRVARMLLVMFAVLLPASASAVTARDIIELSKAGLTDDILIALIDADRTVFTLDKDQILTLKRAGVSKAVLLKMLRTRREFEPVTSVAPGVQTETPSELIHAPAPQPQIVVIGAQPVQPPVTVVVPQYFYVPYSIWGTPVHAPHPTPQPVIAPAYRGFGRFINDGWVDRR